MQPHPPAAPSFSATSSLPLIPDGAALAPMVNLPIPAPATPILFNRWANADPPSPPAHGTPCPQRVAVPFDTPRASQPSGSSLLPSPLFATSFLTLVVEDDALTAVVSLPSRASVRRRSSSAAQQAKESAAGSSRGAAGVLDGTMEVRGVDDERTCDADGAEGTLVARTPRRLERRREPSHLATPQQLQLELYGHGELGEVSFLANEWQQLVDPVLRTPYASGSEVDNDDEEAAIA
ncbi:hypothetical protein B0H19DRAFT_1170179 [Mycena capillaripes]|nr:hypothetical protein B0H19DRAFT_1170179 [Mycena capillaripes]